MVFEKICGIISDQLGISADVITMDTKCQTDFWVTRKDGANLPYLNKGVRVLDAWTPTNYDSNILALTLVDNNHESEMSSYYVENGVSVNGILITIL